MCKKKIEELPVLSQETHVELLAGLLKTTSAMFEKLTPKGFENSSYYFYFRNSPEKEYQAYRTARARMYLFARKTGSDLKVKTMLSFGQWLIDDYQPNPPVMPEEPVSILLDHFLRLDNKGIIFDRGAGSFNFELDVDQIDALMLEALRRAGVQVSPDYSFQCWMRHPYRDPDAVTETGIYQHIFEYLLNEGYEFAYRDNYLPFVLDLQRELEKKQPGSEMGKFESLANSLNLDEPDQYHPEGGYPDFSTAFLQVSNKAPEELLLLYKSVYHVWPEGYPLQIEDYI